MAEEALKSQILAKVKSGDYRPQGPRSLAQEMDLAGEQEYSAFRSALRDLMHAGRVILGQRGVVLPPGEKTKSDEFVGTYRHNKRGFGFVVPTDSTSHEDLYVPEGNNAGAMTGDVVRAKIMSTGQRDGKAIYSGRVTEIITRGQKRFVGSVQKLAGKWVVLPDGNTMTEPIDAPDAAGRHVRPGTKVVIELTQYPKDDSRAVGVITEVLGEAGEKDVDLKGVIVQFNLPGPFPEEVFAQARRSVDGFDPDVERDRRLDITDQVVCTIDPPDAKDYDDAISLRQLQDGRWELGVHIADVSHFVPHGSPLDEEARKRGNSTYFPGHVIPMLPEILSNGVCSLQEGVPRLCKSAFITYDADAKPVGTKFANTIIKSRKRLRYIEAQALIDHAAEVPHPDGNKRREDYEPEVLAIVDQMNALAKRLHKRRLEQGQLTLDLPRVELVLDEGGKVVDAVPEDDAFTHTLIEMFMVEANEAVARLLDGLRVPFLRRTHPTPEGRDHDRLRQFVQVSGHKMPKEMDRKSLQKLLAAVRGKPEGFAINLAVLKSLTRAEYSPQPIGHYALASEHYCHFTSPIRRYADLTVHRLLDAYFAARESVGGNQRGKRKVNVHLEDVPSHDELVDLGKHISFTERQSEGAERELRQVKLLELMKQHIGDEFPAVVTGITNFGLFVQIGRYLIDGLIRYTDLMDDWWEVDDRGGFVRGQRTGTKIGIGDTCRVRIVRVEMARRELDLVITELTSKTGQRPGDNAPPPGGRGKGPPAKHPRKKPSPGRGKPKPAARATAPKKPSKRRGR